jgi:uncharacterized protein (TIGR03083 family)
MNTTQTVAGDQLVRPALDRRTAMRLAAEEYDRMTDVLADIRPDEWSLPTDCPGWDVRQMGCHMVGMAAMASSPFEQRRQQRLAKAGVAAGTMPFIDALTAVQVDERADWTPSQVVEGARRVARRAARGRRLTPGFIRSRELPVPQSYNGRAERWTIGFLVDVILTRDPWMHRMDLAAATGRPPRLTPDHDGVLVADVVAEWARRHCSPYHLTLTGPAGGTWSSGQGGEAIELDAVDFCRVLSGRGEGSGLLATQVPF